MSRYVFKMPDLGEGTVAAEIVACHIKPGDVVTEEQIILDLMTEKATVEVPSPVSGRVVSIAGKPGDSIPVGTELIVFETDTAAASEAPAAVPVATPAAKTATPQKERNQQLSQHRLPQQHRRLRPAAESWHRPRLVVAHAKPALSYRRFRAAALAGASRARTSAISSSSDLQQDHRRPGHPAPKSKRSRSSACVA